jgi:hypothetical protein
MGQVRSRREVEPTPDGSFARPQVLNLGVSAIGILNYRDHLRGEVRTLSAHRVLAELHASSRGNGDCKSEDRRPEYATTHADKVTAGGREVRLRLVTTLRDHATRLAPPDAVGERA